jgi:hypothetical protein
MNSCDSSRKEFDKQHHSRLSKKQARAESAFQVKSERELLDNPVYIHFLFPLHPEALRERADTGNQSRIMKIS